MSKRSENKEKIYITQSTIISEYGLSKSVIEKYLPEPRYVRNPHYSSASPMKLWERETVEKIISENKELQDKKKRKDARKEKKLRRQNNAEDFLKSFSPESLFEEGKTIDREFIVHVGPTNSGKTYQSLNRLKDASSGVYLGPLRLLALEVYENLNSDGILCSLLTGEEYIYTKKAAITRGISIGEARGISIGEARAAAKYEPEIARLKAELEKYQAQGK